VTKMNRRSFAAKATLGLAALGAMSKSGDAQLIYTSGDWKIAEFNHLLKAPARVKQVYDEIQIGGGKFLNNVKNSLNGLHFGFSIPADQIKIVAALHGPANMLNFDDYVWKTYHIGEWLKVNDPKTGKPASRNPFYPSKAGPGLRYASKDPNSEDSLYQDSSIEGLQARGVQFLSCHTATEEQSRALMKQYKLEKQPEEVVKDMMAHTLAGVLVVASMVAAVALLQSEGHYSYITV
jgi:intracellular sulfur oxidation DsrE/DsrF family protein